MTVRPTIAADAALAPAVRLPIPSERRKSANHSKSSGFERLDDDAIECNQRSTDFAHSQPRGAEGEITFPYRRQSPEVPEASWVKCAAVSTFDGRDVKRPDLVACTESNARSTVARERCPGLGSVHSSQVPATMSRRPGIAQPIPATRHRADQVFRRLVTGAGPGGHRASVRQRRSLALGDARRLRTRPRRCLPARRTCRGAQRSPGATPSRTAESPTVVSTNMIRGSGRGVSRTAGRSTGG